MTTADRPLGGKVAVVTGGARGIGAACARALSGAGAAVAVNYASRADKAGEVVAAITAAGGRAVAVQADLGRDDGAATLFAAVDRAFGGPLDILINNAGIFELQHVQEATAEHFDRTVAVNIRGVYLATAEAVKRMRDHGRIITIGSCMADRAMMPTAAVYSMSKAAVAGLTHGWAQDLGGRGITVNCVQPGPVNTDLNPADPQVNPMAGPTAQMTTLKRYGTPQEVAHVVLSLAMPDASYLTGQTITVDGGINA